jgi:hypothetical protein
MLRPVTIEYLNVGGAEGSVSDIIPMDIDGDGFLDLVGTSIHFPLKNKSIPVFTLINDQGGGFESSAIRAAGSTVHAREFVVADFNGDGIDDIFVADHGYDVAPSPAIRIPCCWASRTAGLPMPPPSCQISRIFRIQPPPPILTATATSTFS